VVASLEPIIRFFSYHDAHPVALGMVLMEKFGHDWVDWEPDALKHEIITSFRATSVSDHNWQKIQAFRTCLLVTTPWAEWHIFENIVLAMNNVIPDPFVLQQCSVAQLMAGVDIINQVREEEFGTEIEGYVASCAIDEGLMWLPEPLDFASGATPAVRGTGTVESSTETQIQGCPIRAGRTSSGLRSGPLVTFPLGLRSGRTRTVLLWM
jgi:hypothetical protein